MNRDGTIVEALIEYLDLDDEQIQHLGDFWERNGEEEIREIIQEVVEVEIVMKEGVIQHFEEKEADGVN